MYGREPDGRARLSRIRTLYPTPNLNHVLTARVDHKLFTNNDITVGFQFGKNAITAARAAASTTRIEDAFQEKNNNTVAYNVTDNQVFGASTVNQFRAQWSRIQAKFSDRVAA